MDTNNRKKFEAEFVKTAYFATAYRIKGIHNPFSWNDQANRYVWHDIQAGWEMWEKAQAVPEGFIVVPKELSTEEARKHAEAMFNEVEHMIKYEHRDLSEAEFETFKNRWLNARTLNIQFNWKAMIEAQEQNL
ncbi:hypothetical protein BS636_10360 [Acinetobacter sp. LoGeW2-3]|uniref:hypothetical protein n=1 Tax=Acinetobacter sp. LoGeW2-3 TaxID=1808001 RepID=UPI000C05A976|nr:hypothetical protein [Acinetobacter sp. LoGeW2-3]ATO20029.1 hypothetical protein BS636_10360 [Acinetobacter sp. LoGeW2-3]